MLRSVPSLSAVLVAICIVAAPSAGSAQCAFEHPRKAGKFRASLVQVFTLCGSPNTTTEGGVPACRPPETYNQQAGNPPNGWQWINSKGQGDVQFKASNTAPIHLLNPPGDTTDLAIKVKAQGIVYAAGFACKGGPNNGAACIVNSECPSAVCQEVGIPAGPATGTLATITRVTFNDREGGDMTTIDFPSSFPLPIVNGKINVQTSADVFLNGISQPGLPHCSNIEIVSVLVLDENGNSFANVGLFLP